jgi:hypothetical protein
MHAATILVEEKIIDRRSCKGQKKEVPVYACNNKHLDYV